MMPRGLALLAVVLAAGCTLIPHGPPAIALYAWNRTDQTYILRIGDDNSDTCYRADPGAIGQFYSGVGDIGEGGTRRIRLYAADGRFVSNLGPRTQSDIFVVKAGDQIELLAVKLKPGPSGSVDTVLDMPQTPEVDGRPAPPFLPTTDTTCSG